jgi:hypothetical protein
MIDGQPALKWGTRGKPFTFNPVDYKSKQRAKQQAKEWAKNEGLLVCK